MPKRYYDWCSSELDDEQKKELGINVVEDLRPFYI